MMDTNFDTRELISLFHEYIPIDKNIIKDSQKNRTIKLVINEKL